MTPKQTALINQAAKQEVGGEQWRERMGAWLATHQLPSEFYSDLFDYLANSKHPSILDCLKSDYPWWVLKDKHPKWEKRAHELGIIW